MDKTFANCRSVWDYVKLDELGQGTYGTVCILNIFLNSITLS